MPLHTIAAQFGGVCNMLLAMHTLTGCDSTSYFKERGKKRALKILQDNKESMYLLNSFGESFVLMNDVMDVCISFVCQLYQPTGDITDINYLR